MLNIRKHLPVIIIFSIMLFVIIIYNLFFAVSSMTSNTPIIVIDVGHGGFDPGKVSSSGILEKDVNLDIAIKVRSYLELQDCQVYMTREDDISLNDEHAQNKKTSDLNNRISFIEEKHPTVMVSIHQNSFPASSEHGAQCFYYNSPCSKALAESIQSSFSTLDNQRLAKENSSYFLLRKTSCPSVIVECGFLSNPEECALLCETDYQEQIAYAVSEGILRYIHTYEP